MDADGTPLREAKVVISNSRSKVTFSKNEAIFRSVVPSGSHTVTVTAPGFGEKTVDVVVADSRLSHVTIVMGARHVSDMQTESWLKNLCVTHQSIATVIK
jgi:Carboxypeptidase regulatory-like domain